MEAVSPIIEVVKCVCNPAVRYVGYAKNLKKNFEKLDKMARELYDRRADIQVLVRNTAGAGKIPSSRCETWLKDVNDIEKQMVEMKEKYEQEKKCFKGLCPNVYSRMIFGKHVEDKIDDVSKLVNTFTSDEGVLLDAPTSSVEIMSVPRVEVDSSTTRTVQKILEHIRDGHVQRIGVWGVGGVGKTTVMEMVNNLPEISQMFTVVIWVTVSGDWSIMKVQNEIAARLKLNLEENMSRKLYEKLKNTKEYVKMHDVIRDLALRITSHGGGEGQIFWTRAGAKLEELSPKEQAEWKRANVISLMHNNLCWLPESVDCPVLTTLFLQGNNQLKAIPDSFLEGMPALRVLDLRGTIIMQLPPSVCRLTNLRGLYLTESTWHLFTLPPEIGPLKSLEVLVVMGIRYLPIEIGELGRLRHLRVSFSRARDDDTEHEVQRMIPHGGISRLTHLEDLRIWIDMGDERWNEIVEAVTEEIGALKELCRLDFFFASVENLERFINISRPWNRGLLKSFRFTTLFGRGWKLPNLEDLQIWESSNMLNIWESNSSLTPPLLENLRNLLLNHCRKLKYVFPGGLLPYVPNLETVEVTDCYDLEQIIVGGFTNNTLQKLTSIRLHGLASWTAFVKGSSRGPH
ncbi:putative disease resistance protein [Acorus calamus]|uniref:Disease resistance protein n=1 Tax=Acorus calamus TaxID=4465 RepID=A0AAV9F616_ACOCL|nr:putative disease resistance protein [Acorus calamus]